MKLLFENYRTFLTEVSYDEAKKSLDSKKTIKMIKAYNFDRGVEPEDKLEGLLKIFKYNMSALVPDDIEDNQKGTALLWILGVIRDSKQLRDKVLEKLLTIPDSPLVQASRGQLEKFFHYKQFMDQKDLFKIKDLHQLLAVTNRAHPKILAHQDKQKYMDAGEGTEVFRDDEKWFIAAIHNKGAACQLGKGTEWCTAAPGLDYFGQYYEPEDPLFFLEDVTTGERYQVHFGSDQFMDEEDRPVDQHTEKDLLNLIKGTKAGGKYASSVVAYEDQRTAYWTKDPEMLEQLAAKYLNVRGEAAQRIKSEVISNDNVESPKIYDILSDDKDIRVLYSVASSYWESKFAGHPNFPLRIMEKILTRINNEPELSQKKPEGEESPGDINAASVVTTIARKSKMNGNIVDEIVKYYLSNAHQDVTSKADESGEWDPNSPDTGAYAIEMLFKRRGGVTIRGQYREGNYSHAEIFMTDKQAIELFKTATKYSFIVASAMLKTWFRMPDIGPAPAWKQKYPDLGARLRDYGLKHGGTGLKNMLISSNFGVSESDLLDFANSGDYYFHRSMVNSGIEASNSPEIKKKVYDLILDFADAVSRGEKLYNRDGKEESEEDSGNNARRLKKHVLYRAKSFALDDNNLEVQRHVLQKLEKDVDSGISGPAEAKLRFFPFIDIRKKQVAESINFGRFIKDLI